MRFGLNIWLLVVSILALMPGFGYGQDIGRAVTIYNENARVSASNPLPTQATAGTAVIGKVGIDQTTPGTTNRVSPDITRGTGAVEANTQRVTLATDGPGVANLATIATNTGKVSADLFRSSFGSVGSGVVDSRFTAITTGGMTVAQANGNLTISTGVATGDETLIYTSAKSFKGALVSRAKFLASQRIVRQAFSVSLADLIGTGLNYSVDATGLLITVTIPNNQFTSANVGQSVMLGAIAGSATKQPGRYAIISVNGNNVVFSPQFNFTWARSTTTATATTIGGSGSFFDIGQTINITNSSDTNAVANANSVAIAAATGTTFTFVCLNAGATSGTLTAVNGSMAWTANSTGTLTVWGWNYIRTMIRDATATTADFDCARNGWASGESAITINTSASPGTLVQMQTDGTYVDVSDALVATSTGYQLTTRGSRLENIPDETTTLYLFIQAVNFTTAPATPTTYTVSMVSVEQTQNTKVFLAGAVPGGIGRSVNSIVTATNLSTNIAQLAGATAITISPQGATNKSLAVSLSGVSSAALTTTAYAGNGGTNGATQAVADGGGVFGAFDVSATVVTLGSATQVLFAIQTSYDGGTTWTDKWVTQPITTTGHYRIPAIYLDGRVRARCWSIGGTSTTITATITMTEVPGAAPIQVQMVDVYAATNPFNSVINGTSVASTLVSATLSSTSAVCCIEGCKNVTISGVFSGGTPVTNPTYSLQFSQDATNWFTTATTITPTAAGTFMATATGVCARYARLIVSTASSGGTPYTVAQTVINGVN